MAFLTHAGLPLEACGIHAALAEPGRAPRILFEIRTLCVAGGSQAAIGGPSGSGKTTCSIFSPGSSGPGTASCAGVKSRSRRFPSASWRGGGVRRSGSCSGRPTCFPASRRRCHGTFARRAAAWPGTGAVAQAGDRPGGRTYGKPRSRHGHRHRRPAELDVPWHQCDARRRDARSVAREHARPDIRDRRRRPAGAIARMCKSPPVRRVNPLPLVLADFRRNPFGCAAMVALIAIAVAFGGRARCARTRDAARDRRHDGDGGPAAPRDLFVRWADRHRDFAGSA